MQVVRSSCDCIDGARKLPVSEKVPQRSIHLPPPHLRAWREGGEGGKAQRKGGDGGADSKGWRVATEERGGMGSNEGRQGWGE